MATLKEHQAVLLELLIEFDRVCKKNNIRYILFAGSSLGAARHRGFIPWDDDLDVALLREDYDKLIRLDPAEWNESYYFQGEYSKHWPLHFSKLRKNNTTCLEKYHPKDKKAHQGIYIDVFPIDNASNNKIIRRLQFYASKIVQARSFWKRGYETNSVLKRIIMLLSCILPLKLFKNIVVMPKTNKSEYVHSFLGGSINFHKGIFKRKWITDTIHVPFETITVPVSAYYHELLSMQYGDYMTLPPVEERKCKIHAVLVDTENSYENYLDYQDDLVITEYSRSIR